MVTPTYYGVEAFNQDQDSYGGEQDGYADGGSYDGGEGGEGNEETPAAYGNGKSEGSDHGQAVDAAVNSKHSINTFAIKTVADHQKTPVININSGPLPLQIRFTSHSSNIEALQTYIGSPGKVKKSSSVDHPDILLFQIKRPIIQELREIVTPYRKRIQEIKPTNEKVSFRIFNHQYLI